ncbi:MAG: TIGR02757 family protein [Muribaculaceae bacterium]|nr:TIGR02757 family protein [Muribaculaceae bacterium]
MNTELPVISSDIIELLDSEAKRINRPEFIENDPVQFPRQFTDVRDIEVAALLSAIIAWGNRKMICRDAGRLMGLMDHAPYKYIMEQGYEDFPDEVNIHRTFFGRNLKHLLRGLHEIYKRHESLDAFSASIRAGEEEAPAWRLVEAINGITADANGGRTDSRGLPQNLKMTALKRVNMALRWLVRDDGIVDMGVWHSIPKSKLYIPLDVHVGNTARDLGLITRRANDRKTVDELTEQCRLLRPDDPCLYDYALFGIGIGC